MHTFQDMPAEMIEVDPFTSFGQEWAVLTAENDVKANGMTISWGALGALWNKNVVIVFVRDSRYTKEIMDDSDTFSISFFGGKEKNSLRYLGKASGRNEDKFAAVNFQVNHHKGIPFVDECSFAIVCKKIAAHKLLPEGFLIPEIEQQFYSDKEEGNLHTMYIGEVVDFLAR